MSANNRQVGGSHYQSAYQHWDYVQDCLSGRYLEGVITKYASRWRKKNGLEDLKKALHYLEKLKEEYAANRVEPLGEAATVNEAAERFVKAQRSLDHEARILELLPTWSGEQDLDEVGRQIKTLIAKAEAL